MVVWLSQEGKVPKQKTFKLSTSDCWSLQFLKKALKCTSVINGYMYKKQHLLCKTDLQKWGNRMNASHWIVLWQAVSTIWAGLEVNVAGHERRRTFPSTNSAEPATCLFFSIKQWSSMTGALALKLLPILLLSLFLCQIHFYFSSKYLWRHNFRLFIAMIYFVFMMCAYVKLSILPYECVAVCSYSSPGVWSVG